MTSDVPPPGLPEVSNPHPGTAEPGKLVIIPLPVVIFTEADAEAIAALTPAEPLPGFDHAVAVVGFTDPAGLAKGEAVVRVTHHAKKHKNGKERIVGQWDVKVPIGRVIMDKDDHSKHICRVYLKPPAAQEAPKPTIMGKLGKILRLPGNPSGTILGADGKPKT
jgi:hypothetical protein